MKTINFEPIIATATNQHTRIEKHGKKTKVNALDIDFVAIVDANWLQLLAENEESLSEYDALMFDENGEVKQTGLSKLEFESKYSEHEIKIALDDLFKNSIEMKDIVIKKFTARPEFGHKIKIFFQIQCHPTDKQYKFIRAAVLKDDVMVSVTAPEVPESLSDPEVEQADMLGETTEASNEA